MPNICSYSMMIQGKPNDVEEVIKTLKADYDYGAMKFSHDKHLFRVFEANVDEESDYVKDDYRAVVVYGDCAWSVYSCMFDGEHTYYRDFKDNINAKCTTLPLLSKDTNTIIEVFSEEVGMAFQEHYLIKYGGLIVNESTPYYEIFKDSLEEDGIAIEEYIKKLDESYTMDDVSEEYDYYIIGGFDDWDFEYFEDEFK